MLVNTKRLRHASVRTVSGVVLGKFLSTDLDVDSGRVHAIHIQPRGTVAGLLSHDLVVAWTAVVSMTEEEIVVKDASVSAPAMNLAASLIPPAQVPSGSHFSTNHDA